MNGDIPSLLRNRSRQRLYPVVIASIFLFFYVLHRFRQSPSNYDRKKVAEKLQVRIAVTFPEFVLLSVEPTLFPLINSSPLLCLYGDGDNNYSPLSQDRTYVICPHPPESSRKQLHGQTITLKVGSTSLTSNEVYNTTESWQSLVYEAVNVSNGVLVFAKGLPSVDKARRIPDISKIVCLFGGNVTVQPTASCQESVLCPIPSGILQGLSSWSVRRDITLQLPEGHMPSVASVPDHFLEESAVDVAHSVCMCTVLWNSAKFLKEWIVFHSLLGVQHTFLYDNNSDDDLQEVVQQLMSKGFRVSIHPWPWLKSQESAFSHCAIRSSKICKFTMFMDVDEFLNPYKSLDPELIWTPESLNPSKPQPARSSIISRLIDHATAKLPPGKSLGAVSVKCFSFGPSGLQNLPETGQVVNYLCRERGAKRVKSIVRTGALLGTRCNRIHRFNGHDFLPGHIAVNLTRREAVIHHFKYPIWDDFKLKFYRRVSSFVSDWTENENLSNRDRVQGLGTVAVKPQGWEYGHCYVNDTRLKDFVMTHMVDNDTKLLRWQ